jgi:hypothetical protein
MKRRISARVPGNATERSSWNATARLAALAALALFAVEPRADVDLSVYESETALRDPGEQARYLQQIERERVDEARREAQRLAEEARAAEERRRVESQRPWPERLTEQRCTLCHAATNYTANAHSWIGWWAVMLRMKYMNAAPLGWEEMPPIVAHLSEQHPAGTTDAVLEWAAFAGGLLAPVALTAGAIWHWRRRVGRRRQGRGPTA